jgi:hypothetical protein
MDALNVALLVAAIVCGFLTLVFILRGLFTAYRHNGRISGRGLLIATLLSLLTSAVTIWQLVQTLRQLNL